MWMVKGGVVLPMWNGFPCQFVRFAGSNPSSENTNFSSAKLENYKDDRRPNRPVITSTAKLKDRGAKASMKVEDRILKVMYLHYEENPKVTMRHVFVFRFRLQNPWYFRFACTMRELRRSWSFMLTFAATPDFSVHPPHPPNYGS